MSSPDTDPKKEAKRHKPSLLGISLSVLVAILFLVWMLTRVLGNGEPEEVDQAAPTQVEDASQVDENGETDLGIDAAPEVIEEEPAPTE